MRMNIQTRKRPALELGFKEDNREVDRLVGLRLRLASVVVFVVGYEFLYTLFGTSIHSISKYIYLRVVLFAY